MFNNFFKKNSFEKKGFTLVEIMVASSVFFVVMLIVSGSIITIFDANRKSRNIRSVLDNLNLSIESMTRTIRFGTNYHCGNSGNIYEPRDCVSPGEDSFTLEAPDTSTVTYSLVGGRIRRSSGGQDHYITSSDVTITRLSFITFGSVNYTNGNSDQPFVIILVSGYVGSKPSVQSSFSIQTALTQRIIDLS